ncbi:MAG: NADH-quinone oxidoreductase subunit D [Acidobacteriota bacterium]
MFQTEQMVVNLGPQHPSTHGVLRILLHLDGERVVDSQPVIGYLHRGVEKLAESREYVKIAPYTDRMDYVNAMSGNLAYLGAVEKLCGLEVPEKAGYIRVIMVELNRIASHLLWLGTHALDLGAMSIFLYGFREREMILDLFEAYCGARLTYNAFRISGVPEDLPPGWKEECTAFLELFRSRHKEYDQILTRNRIWLRRTKEVGVMDAAQCLALSVTGPVLRAAGIPRDLRKDEPYAIYDQLDFDVPVSDGCDTYARYQVRMEEMLQSARIVEQCLRKMPAEGPLISIKGRKMRPRKNEEVYFAVEGPRGEQGVYLVSDGTDRPYRCKFRNSSFANLQALAPMIKGLLVADVVAIIGTLDIVLGDSDR